MLKKKKKIKARKKVKTEEKLQKFMDLLNETINL